MQLSFFSKTKVDGSTTLDDLLRVTNHIDIEILSETEEEAKEKIELFSDYGCYEKIEKFGDKWFQINSKNGKLNVFSYYEKES